MKITRRQFIATSTVSAALTSSGRLTGRAGEPGPEPDVKVDSLCYFTYTRDWNATAISEAARKAIQGGLNAIVFDGIFPREYSEAVNRFADWGELYGRPDSPVLPILQATDFKQAKDVGKLGVVLACQDATILGPLGRATATIEMFHRLGLRVLQLTHNARTQWGDSCLEKRDAGLSQAGEKLIQAMNKVGILIDLSHCSHQTLIDGVALSTQPCAVTHAGCRALSPTARNKSDEEIRVLGAKGGYFGVFNQLNWLTNQPGGNINVLLNHIDHAIQLIGPAQVGFGSDGYISDLDADAELKDMREYQQRGAGKPTLEWSWDAIRVPELNSPKRLEVLGDALSHRGYKDDEVKGVLGNNFVRLFQRVCG